MSPGKVGNVLDCDIVVSSNSFRAITFIFKIEIDGEVPILEIKKCRVPLHFHRLKMIITFYKTV